jgi:hypothetical protein
MSEKQKLIKRMLQLQQKFMQYEHEHAVDPAEYWNPPPGHPLYEYRQEYASLAKKVVDLAHKERGSQR